MYFKKLEIYGFKSFAEKTVLEFEPGVTAIVGPNGCGKSNIGDAIKWVLGEQSAKQLRGSAMEDVIFNGTDKAQPVNLAEVSLTLSNENKILPVEYEEVTVTRRVFRSGESEYLLNKNPVRLKDINELFMDTGIGTSAYSIMEQGKVDQILSSRAEDRREVFEEVAGITKFKSKKNEALRKLEQTEQNLLRVADIITEVKRQIGSVERQAQKAKRYKEEFEKLKELELKKAGFEFKNINEQKEAAKKEYTEIKNNENTFSLKINSFAGELDTAKQQLFTTEDELSRKQAQAHMVETEINTGKNKISLNNERLEELDKRKISLEKEIVSFNQKISDLNSQLENLKSAVIGLKEDQSAKSALLERKDNYLVELSDLIKKAEDEIIKSRKDLLEAAAGQSRLKNEITKISANISNISARQRRLRMEKENVAQDMAGVEGKLTAYADEFNRINREWEDLNRQKQELEAFGNKTEQELKEVSEQVNSTGNRQLSLKSKLELLEDLKSRYEGFSGGVKALLGKNKPQHLKGIIEVVANLIEVHKGYEFAAEAALGDHAQDIIVETNLDAREAMDYLSKNSLGQARFLILENINNQPAPGNNDSNSVINFININERYRRLLNVLLKDIFAVNNLEDAAALKTSKPGTFVTLKGERIDDYSLSGGSVSLNENAALIGREGKIRELKDELSQIENSLADWQNKESSLKAQLGQLKAELEDKTNKLQEAQIVLANKKNEQANIEQEKKKLGDEVLLLDSELEEILAQLNQFNQSHESLNKNLSSVDEEHLSIQNIISSNQDLIARKAKEREEVLIEITQIKTEITSLIDKAREQEKTKDNLERSIIDEGLALKSRQGEADSCLTRREELLKEISGLRGVIEDKAQEKEILLQEISGLTQKKNKSLTVMDEIEVCLRKEQKALDEIKNTLHHLEMKNNQFDFKAETLKNRIEQVYKVDLASLPLLSEEGTNWEEVDKKVSELRDKLEGMGPVNLVAIEEHQELQDRFSFLTKQQEDLVQAKDQLAKAISKINKTTHEMFEETFKKIQVEFRNLFKMLFGGGDAELILVDQENLLESGIEIIARPPGKKLQNISLLSGGEKALTATALLFSFFKIKPSPFCVMDEIDAPLDESNIGRFCRVLQDFIKQSQFIIITHNKKTISMADVMYGITMQQSGISKIVSVKFADKKIDKKEETGKTEERVTA